MSLYDPRCSPEHPTTKAPDSPPQMYLSDPGRKTAPPPFVYPDLVQGNLALKSSPDIKVSAAPAASPVSYQTDAALSPTTTSIHLEHSQAIHTLSLRRPIENFQSAFAEFPGRTPSSSVYAPIWAPAPAPSPAPAPAPVPAPAPDLRSSIGGACDRAEPDCDYEDQGDQCDEGNGNQADYAGCGDDVDDE